MWSCRGRGPSEPGGGIPRLWRCSELAAGQNVDPGTIHLSQSSKWVPGPRKTILGYRARSESEAITESGEVGKARTERLCPLGEKPGPRGSSTEDTSPGGAVGGGGVPSQQDLSFFFCETRRGPSAGEATKEFWWKTGAGRTSHTPALQPRVDRHSLSLAQPQG